MIDLRSDTVTMPTPAMKQAMFDAPLGDDVYSEDPTVNELQDYVAKLLGKEAGLFVPTGVMSNQLCLKVLTNPGDEFILGANSHIFNYETGAPALLSGVQLHTIPDTNGYPSTTDVIGALREDAYYLPRTAALALEQTHNRAGGVVIPMGKLNALTSCARELGIGLHLDGARLFNAVVASGIPAKQYAEMFDTVSICLSKGLGAPIGSVMCGTHELVTKAHKFRKIWGGGWRQAGILAAAGLYALKNHVGRLHEDHTNAKQFAELIVKDERISIPNLPETNLVVFLVKDIDVNKIADRCAEKNLLVSAAFKGKLRVAFHQEVSGDDTVQAAEILLNVMKEFHS